MTESQPLVSILCPTYNQEKFIADAIEGFIMQKTTFPFEIIVHDDASTDNTPAIIKEYETKHPGLFANIYQTENQFSKGTGIVMRTIYGAARGKYIALCEGDDYWTDSYKLQKQVDFLTANPEYISSYHNAAIDTKDHPDPWAKKGLFNPDATDRDITTEDLILRWDVPTASIVFATSIVVGLPAWIYTTISGDLPLMFILSVHGKIRYMNDAMSVYRMQPQGLSHTHKGIFKIRGTAFLYQHFNIYSKGKFEKTIDQAIEELIKVFYMKNEYVLSTDVKSGSIELTLNVLIEQLFRKFKNKMLHRHS